MQDPACFTTPRSLELDFLQVDLYSDVDAKRSSAVVDQSGVTFALSKVARGLWGRLTAAGEKQEILNRRQKSVEAFREAAGKQKEDAKLLKVRNVWIVDVELVRLEIVCLSF